MKHPLLSSLCAGAVALAIPLQMLAAFTSPSALFWAWTNSAQPKDFTAEVHVQLPSENVFLSAWMKGSQEGGFSMKADGMSDVTIDIVAPKEDVNARLKASLRSVDGNVYVKINSLTGTFDDELAQISAEFAGKQWIMLPKDMTMMEHEDPFAALSERLADDGVEVSAADIKNLVNSLLDAGLSVSSATVAGGYEYTILPKRHFLKEMKAVLADFAATQDLPSAMDEKELTKIEREVLRQLKLQIKVRTDAADNPVSMSAALSLMPSAGEFKVIGKMTAVPHKGALTVTAPADAVPFDNTMMGAGLNDPAPTWDTPAWEEEVTPWDPCDDMSSIERIAAQRKGRCGDQRNVRPRR